MAAHHRLVQPDGTIVCWACKGPGASFPTLHCPACLYAHKTRHEAKEHFEERVAHGVTYRFPRQSDDEHRWSGMIRNMRHEARLDREAATRLLNNAKDVPGADKWHGQLKRAFDERFGAPEPPQGKHGDAQYAWQRKPTCWDTMDLDPSATRAEVVKRYRDLALTWHPDRIGGDGSKMAEINHAYRQCLAALDGDPAEDWDR